MFVSSAPPSKRRRTPVVAPSTRFCQNATTQAGRDGGSHASRRCVQSVLWQGRDIALAVLSPPIRRCGAASRRSAVNCDKVTRDRPCGDQPVLLYCGMPDPIAFQIRLPARHPVGCPRRALTAQTLCSSSPILGLDVSGPFLPFLRRHASAVSMSAARMRTRRRQVRLLGSPQPTTAATARHHMDIGPKVTDLITGRAGCKLITGSSYLFIAL